MDRGRGRGPPRGGPGRDYGGRGDIGGVLSPAAACRELRASMSRAAARRIVLCLRNAGKLKCWG